MINENETMALCDSTHTHPDNAFDQIIVQLHGSSFNHKNLDISFFYLAFAPIVAAFLTYYCFVVLARLRQHTKYKSAKSTRSLSSRLPPPPGPKPLPLIGNTLQWPREYQWLTFADWAKRYGDVVFASTPGIPSFIIINSKEAAHAILEKQSASTADRPRLAMVHELMNVGSWTLPFMVSGDRWRTYRKALHRFFAPGVVQNYHHAHAVETHLFLQRLLESPQHFRDHVKHLAAGTTMRVTFGMNVTDPKHEYVTMVQRGMRAVSKAAVPGSYLVDLLPFLKYLPWWFPVATFKAAAMLLRYLTNKHMQRPFNDVATAMASDDSALSPSVASELIRTSNKSGKPEDDDIARHVALAAYTAGPDTLTSVFLTFFLAMATQPVAQQRAQAELDAVLGPGPARMPTFADRPALPYLDALLKEVLRWQPASPVAITHMATKEITYNGYSIPEGSYLCANSWAMLHDEATYPDAFSFRPERFLKDSQGNSALDPAHFAYGYGRRVCAGRHLAENALFLLAASVLSSFTIAPALDEAGNPIPISCEMTSGLVSFPVPFKCTLQPRSTDVPSMVSRELETLGVEIVSASKQS